MPCFSVFKQVKKWLEDIICSVAGRYKAKHRMAPKPMIFNSASRVDPDERVEIFLFCEVKLYQLDCHHVVNKSRQGSEAVHM